MPVAVRYCPLNRPLHDKTDIFLHHGFNNWNNAGKVQMQSAADGFFAATIDVPVTATVLDVVFSDGQGSFDNADRADFHAPVRNASEKLEISRMSAVLERFEELTSARYVKEEADKMKNAKRGGESGSESESGRGDDEAARARAVHEPDETRGGQIDETVL